MDVKKVRVVVTTDGAGAATAFSEAVKGELRQILYNKTDFSNGSTFLITHEETGELLWNESSVNASAARAPRLATHTTLGAAALYAAGGVAVLDRIALTYGRIKIVITSGGATKTGTFDFIVS